MDAQKLGQQSEQRHRGLTRKLARRIIYILIAISLLLFIVGIFIYVLIGLGTIHGDWANKLFTILPGLGDGAIAIIAFLGIFQFILSLIPDEPKIVTPPLSNQLPATNSQTISPPLSTNAAPDPTSVPAASPPASRGIVGFPPPTDPRTIQQREQAVRDIYGKLIQPSISAVVLTGIGGQGKSTLAALVYRYRRNAAAQRPRLLYCPATLVAC